MSKSSADSGRCCAHLRNRRTGKTRRCTSPGTHGGFCSRHAPAIDEAKQMARDAMQAAIDFDPYQLHDHEPDTEAPDTNVNTCLVVVSSSGEQSK